MEINDLTGLRSVLVETPLGFFRVKGSLHGITAVTLLDEKKLGKASEPPPESADHPVEEARRQLLEYFEKKRQTFDLKLDFSGAPPFHAQVWQELLNVPYGKTNSYFDIAERLGDVNAVRAVGQANGKNPIAIIVPCHRIIGKKGALTGYFYGLDTKMFLLRLENPARYPIQTSLF